LIVRAFIAAGLSSIAAIGLVACQSTQGRSAELEDEGATTLLADSGLKIEKESSDVRVTSKMLLSDSYGAAVVVGLHNDSSKGLVDVPILLDVRDTKGKSVYSNDISGIEPALASVPYIPPGGDAEWVNDQVLVSGKPHSVKVKVGTTSHTYSGPIPDIRISEPALEGDPVSGVEATGDVINESGEDQERVLLYVIARKGGEIVAAGRGAIEHLKADGKPRHYDVFFIGDPTGADLELTQFPTLPGAEPK
jgi:hypothetical protein